MLTDRTIHYGLLVAQAEGEGKIVRQRKVPKKNDERRLLLRELVQLEQTKESLRAVWLDEEASYDSPSAGFKETGQGVSSMEAIKELEEAVFRIEDACEAKRCAV